LQPSTRQLSRLQPGDLCSILVDQVQEALDHLALRISEVKTNCWRVPDKPAAAGASRALNQGQPCHMPPVL
jgi:hypothetical protein